MEKKLHWKFEIGGWKLEIGSPISNLQSRISNRALLCLCLLLLFPVAGLSAQEQETPLDLHSIPISEWLNSGDHTEIPWNFRVNEPYLRVDQRLEVLYSVQIDAKTLNKTGKQHELFLISRISTPDGEWLNQPSILRQDLDKELPSNRQAQFFMWVVVQPGDYMLWGVLYDRKTGKHNVTRHHFKVPDIHGDPLPDLYSKMPLVEFPDYGDSDQPLGVVNSLLYLPVRNKRPIQIELISMLSPPEQWTGCRGCARAVRAHNNDTLGALSALSQMEPAVGTMSIAGLDLVRRQVIFDQRDFKSVKWSSLMNAMKKAGSPDISASALQGSKNNGAFFRDFVDKEINAEPGEGSPLRVFIVVTSSTLFESGADLKPLQIEGDCHCRAYYLRFRLNINDVFDQLERFIKPLHPRVFDLITARDLRKAIAEIVGDLGKL
jgi:hypothetical protein